MRKLMAFAVSTVIVVSGCAGSASHDVVSSYEATDITLTCEQIPVEIYKAQSVIDDVAKDRADLSGKDMLDGLLWFPFNLIAKSNNYDKATEAAGKRIERLEKLKQEKNC